MPLQGDAIVIGSKSAFAMPIANRLADDGYRVVGLGEQDAELRPELKLRQARPTDFADLRQFLDTKTPGFEPSAIVIAPRLPEAGAIGDISPATFIAELDDALGEAGHVAKSLVTAGRANRPPRIVLLSDWTAFWQPQRTTAAAVMGGMLGLARSWALEFAPLGVTANAVVVGPDTTSEAAEAAGPTSRLARRPTPDDVAHAVSFFLDPRSGAITGQVLAVCGGRTPGTVPV